MLKILNRYKKLIASFLIKQKAFLKKKKKAFHFKSLKVLHKRNVFSSTQYYEEYFIPVFFIEEINIDSLNEIPKWKGNELQISFEQTASCSNFQYSIALLSMLCANVPKFYYSQFFPKLKTAKAINIIKVFQSNSFNNKWPFLDFMLFNLKQKAFVDNIVQTVGLLSINYTVHNVKSIARIESERKFENILLSNFLKNTDLFQKFNSWHVRLILTSFNEKEFFMQCWRLKID